MRSCSDESQGAAKRSRLISFAGVIMAKPQVSREKVHQKPIRDWSNLDIFECRGREIEMPVIIQRSGTGNRPVGE